MSGAVARSGGSDLVGFVRALKQEVKTAERQAINEVDTKALCERMEGAASILAACPDLNEGLETTMASLRERITALKESKRAWEASQPAEEISIDLVRSTFYNLMAEYGTSDRVASTFFFRADVPEVFAALSIIEAIRRSSDLDGIACLGKTTSTLTLTQSNCPAPFKAFAGAILGMKERVLLLSKPDCTRLTHLILQGSDPTAAVAAAASAAVSAASMDPVQMIASAIQEISKAICQNINFQATIVDVLLFCMEVKGCLNAAPPAVVRRDPSPESLVGVTSELVRETFYTFMKEHVRRSGGVSDVALESEDSYIFFALSMHALIEGLTRSPHINNGVALLHDKILTEGNCPADYRGFAGEIFARKDRICQLTPLELLIVKMYCVDEPGSLLSKRLEQLRRPELKDLATALRGVAQEISQRQTFQRIIGSVITDCRSSSSARAASVMR